MFILVVDLVNTRTGNGHECFVADKDHHIFANDLVAQDNSEIYIEKGHLAQTCKTNLHFFDQFT